MADFTQHTSDQDSSPHSSSHSSMSPDSMSSGMSMAFHTSLLDVLYSTSWKPLTPAQYTGTLIFLILLALVYRFLVAWKSVLEHSWAKRDNDNVVLVAAGKAESFGSEEAEGKRRSGAGWGVKTWRWSVDLPRAGIHVVISGVGYLLMLAVMTFNVGYFLAVLGGIFLGELVFGRWIRGGDH